MWDKGVTFPAREIGLHKGANSSNTDTPEIYNIVFGNHAYLIPGGPRGGDHGNVTITKEVVKQFNNYYYRNKERMGLAELD